MFSMSKLLEVSLDYNVLYVEDDNDIAIIITKYLKKLFNKVDCACNGEEGLDLYSKNKYDLVVTDIQMPKVDGLEMSKQIKKVNEEQNIIIISAYSDICKLTESIKIGVDGYILKPINYDNLNSTLFKVVNKIKKFQENDLYEKSLKILVDEKVQENTKLQIEKINNYEQTLFALIDIIESRDTYTGKHSLRVANYSKLISQRLGFSATECDEIYKAGVLHDIGKVAIPDSLLLKPTKLIEEEYNLIKEHVQIGFHMLTQVPMLNKIAKIIRSHHEKIDGSGYPNSLKNEEISIESNILAFADAFDSMTTNRIYKKRKSVVEALRELESLKEIHYKEEIVDAAKEVLSHIILDESINQLPTTSLEKARFTYFYNDNLTGLYNDTYLSIILVENKMTAKYNVLNLISIPNFYQYNKKHGWLKGNELLMNISNKISLLYKDDDIFRIHADDFVILSTSQKIFETNKIKDLSNFIFSIDCSLSCELKMFDIIEGKINSIYDLEKYL